MLHQAPAQFRPRRRKAAKTPAASPAAVSVVSVAIAGVDTLSAVWTFDRDVADPTDDVDPFQIDVLGAADWTREGARTLHFYYTDTLTPGMTWSNPAGAAGVVGTDGGALAAGSGTLLP